MIKVAITGGIGTGKTTILNMFADKGIPVFNSDEIAREIMNTNALLILPTIASVSSEHFIWARHVFRLGGVQEPPVQWVR